MDLAQGFAPAAEFDGIVHHLGSCSYASRGGVLYCSRDGERTWSPHARLPLTLLQRIQSTGRLQRRLWRAAVHHVVPLSDETLVVFGYRRIYRFDSTGGCIGVSALHGSRPLCVCVDHDVVYYGEYRANREATPVHVWTSADGGATWTAAHRFHGVRHVHGVFLDPYEEALWITTGDDDGAAGIWSTEDGFRTVERVAGGSQQTRAVQLVFTPTHVYFGSDAPTAANYLYRIRRADRAVERLQPVAGPVYYGCRVRGRLFFSTACEPPTLPATRDVTVWWSADGERWRRLAAFRKDRWPAGILQHGHVLFPGGPRARDADGVWMTPVAVRGDQRSVKLGFESVGQAMGGCSLRPADLDGDGFADPPAGGEW